MSKISQGKYFTIFAPRQSGKTTYFKMLMELVKARTSIVPIWLSFENLMNYNAETFYSRLRKDMLLELKIVGFDTVASEFNEIDGFMDFFQYFKSVYKKDMLLVIDEFDGVPEAVLNELMHTFRKMYHKKELHALTSLILVGVKNITGVNLDNASPFRSTGNITSDSFLGNGAPSVVPRKRLSEVIFSPVLNIADEVKISYFSPDEVKDLICQYVEETGQRFDKEAIDEIIFNTGGQPGLVNAFCRELVENEVYDKSKAVDIESFRKVLKAFLTEKLDKNISNIVNKAKQEKDLIIKILFEEEVPFSIYDERIKYLNVNGVVSNKEDICEVEPPIYKKALISAFKPILNGEKIHYISPYESFEKYATEDSLNIMEIIESYRQYIKRRGFKAFDTDKLMEGACHYSFDNYINFFMDGIGGSSFIEPPSGRGIIDIILLYRDKKYVVEIKRFAGNNYLQRGKRQLSKYLSSEGLDEGYYVVFSNVHNMDEGLYTEEVVEGKKIYTWIIRTNFEVPSKA